MTGEDKCEMSSMVSHHRIGPRCYKCGCNTNGRHVANLTDGDYEICCTCYDNLVRKLLDLMVEMKKAGL